MLLFPVAVKVTGGDVATVLHQRHEPEGATVPPRQCDLSVWQDNLVAGI